MLIKAGVDISRLNREIRRAVGEVSEYLARDGVELVITSTYEGNHLAGSLHYANDAFDFRRYARQNNDYFESLTGLLGSAFDVVLHKNSVHIEYDPKS